MSEPRPVITFRALHIVNEQRNTYGMRYNDLTRYRKHCANRTHRLRAMLKMTHGKGRDFKALPPLTMDIIKEGHLLLLLLETERAWVHSQELLTQAVLPANATRANALRRSATSRFRRALNWSAQLLSNCQALYPLSRLSAENLIQVTIYSITIKGRFLRCRDDFERAFPLLSVARALLNELAGSASTSRDQALAVYFSDEISPEIRHCAYELGRERAYDVDKIVAELAPAHRNAIVEGCDALIEQMKFDEVTGGEAKKQLNAFIWEGEPVPIRDPDLVDVLLKVQEADGRLRKSEFSDPTLKSVEDRSKKGVAAYDGILSALSDAEQVARKLVETHQLRSATPSNGHDIQFVHAFILYQLLSRRIQRDLLLISALLSSHPGAGVGFRVVQPLAPPSASVPNSERVNIRLYPAIVKLLDTALQSLDQMRSLSIVDDSPHLASAVDAWLSFTKARRCLYLSCCYPPSNKYAEGLALLQHANIHVRETYTSLSLCKSAPSTPLDVLEVNELETAIASTSLQFKRDWFAYNGGSTTAEPTSHMKPLFFNIALNYVKQDMDKLLERAGKALTGKHMTEQALDASQPLPAKLAPKSKDLRSHSTELQETERGGLSSLLPRGWWSRS